MLCLHVHVPWGMTLSTTVSLSLHLHYVVQVVNSQRGHHAVIALLHRRSKVPKVEKCVKCSQTNYIL
jgi:hypothetical protein